MTSYQTQTQSFKQQNIRFAARGGFVLCFYRLLNILRPPVKQDTKHGFKQLSQKHLSKIQHNAIKTKKKYFLKATTPAVCLRERKQNCSQQTASVSLTRLVQSAHIH
jgi:hypothetical protein